MTVVAFVDGEELGRATVRVTTLGARVSAGMLRENVQSRTSPCSARRSRLAWQQNSQNFVITDCRVEDLLTPALRHAQDRPCDIYLQYASARETTRMIAGTGGGGL